MMWLTLMLGLSNYGCSWTAEAVPAASPGVAQILSFGGPGIRKLLINPGAVCHIDMKTIINLSLLAVLLALAPSRCLAARSIGTLSPNDAKEMGVEVRATPAGPDAVWLEVEFKTGGKLKEYNPERSSHVELEIRDGEKSLLSYAALQEQHPAPGHVRVRFMANRAYLDKLVVTIVVGSGAMVGGAYELHLKDFVDLAKTR